MKASQTELSQPELRALLSYHMQGFFGKCGSMTKKQRGDMLQGLIDKGYMVYNPYGTLTQKAITAINNNHNAKYAS